MASNNNTKEIILQLFADNTVGNITAQTMRDYINAIFDDSEVQFNKFQTLNDFEAQDNPSIYEGSLVVIYNSSDSEQGIYYATINQPRERQFLTQLSSNIKENGGVTTSYEYTANANQYMFACNYTNNQAVVYVDGKKVPVSKVDTLATTSITLTTPLSGGEEVEIIATIG